MEGGSKHDLLSLVNQPLDTPTEKKEESEMHVKDEMKQLVEQEEKDAMTKEKSEVKKDLGDSGTLMCIRLISIFNNVVM